MATVQQHQQQEPLKGQQQIQSTPPSSPPPPPPARRTSNADSQEEEADNLYGAIKTMRTKYVPKLKFTLLIAVAINFAMFIVGCIKVHKCPVNPNIPFFVIVIGGVGLSVKFLTYVRERISKYLHLQYVESALYTIYIVFFFLGTYWTYNEFKPNFEEPNSPLYCDKTVYMFAFIYITFYYVLILSIPVFICCFVICFCALTAKAIHDIPESQVPCADETPSVEEGRAQETV